MAQRWGIQCYQNVKSLLIILCPLGQSAHQNACPYVCLVCENGCWNMDCSSPLSFRCELSPLCTTFPEPPGFTCWTHAHRNAGIMGAFQRRRTPLGSRNAFPLVRAPVCKYILSPLQEFLSVFSRALRGVLTFCF